MPITVVSRQHDESLSLPVARTVAIIENCHVASVVPHSVQTPPIPRRWRQGLQLEGAVHLRHKTAKPADHEIAKRGMVVVLAAFGLIVGFAFPILDEHRARQPFAGHRIQVLVNPRNDSSVRSLSLMRGGILMKQADEEIPPYGIRGRLG